MPRCCMPRDELYVAELVEAAREISQYMHGVTENRWNHDSMLRSAVLHQLTIIGEVARALPEDLRQRHPHIPWEQMRGFRNIAVHEYFALDTGLVLRIARDEIPELSRQALSVLRHEYPDLAKHYDHTDAADGGEQATL